MKQSRSVIAALATIGVVSAFWLRSAWHEAGDSVSIQFVGMTNDPAIGSAALLCVSNKAVGLVVCAELSPQVHSSSGWVDVDKRGPSGLGYLERGESHCFTVPVPAGAEPWRVPVLWQRQDLGRFEQIVNGEHDQLVVLSGKPRAHRDALRPFRHVVLSPEIGR